MLCKYVNITDVYGKCSSTYIGAMPWLSCDGGLVSWPGLDVLV